MRDREVAVAMAIVAALVVLSILASVLFIRPRARGEGGVHIGSMLVAGCGLGR
jgi:hypothetical protein